MKVCLCPLLPPLDLGQPGKKVQSCSYLCLSFVHKKPMSESAEAGQVRGSQAPFHRRARRRLDRGGEDLA